MMTQNHDPNPPSHNSTGVLGRGPWFWALLMVISAAIIAFLAISRAVEDKSALMILLFCPALLMVPLYLSAQRRAGLNAEGCTDRGAAQRAYIKRVAIFTSLYLATFAFMTFSENELAMSDGTRFLIALLPGLAVIGFFWAIGRLIMEEQDEFLRMLTVRQSLIASGLALSAASVWGFLESADLVSHLDAYWFAIVWFFGIGVGAVANRFQYGTWGAV